MYKISFSTSNYVNNNSDKVTGLILDAKIKSLDGVSYEYKEIEGPLLNRLHFMLCLHSTIDGSAKINNTKVVYNFNSLVREVIIPLQLPGCPTVNYNDVKEAIDYLSKYGFTTLPFSLFYKSKQFNLDGAYIKIEKLNTNTNYPLF